MQCICKQCARVLLSPDERAFYIKKMKDPRIDALIRSAIFKKVVDLCKRASRCPYCSYANGALSNEIMHHL
jgi:DNA-directed RNA polymerase III subunit RPC1